MTASGRSWALADGVPPDLGPLLARMAGMGYSDKTARALLREASGNRVARRTGYGNAVNPEVTAVFIRAFMQTMGWA